MGLTDAIVPEAIIDHILEEWRKHLAMEPELEEAHPLPSREALASMLTAIFWASLGRNEARGVQFRLALLGQTDADFRLRLQEPIPLDADSLKRVGLANDVTDQALLAELQSVSGVIWGMGRMWLDVFLECEVSGVGEIVVRGGGEPLVAFDQTKYRQIGIDRQSLALSMGVFLTGEANPDQARWAAWFWGNVVRAIRAQGNGGTIIVVPKGTRVADLSVDSPSPFALKDMWWYSSRAPSDKDEQMKVDYLRSSAEQMARWIGRLTTLDGAVVCDSDFRVLAFGAKLTAVGSPTIRELTPFAFGPNGREVALERLGGTRHQSAARFVAYHRGVSALVISHDGPVSWISFDKATQKATIFRRIDWYLGRNV